MRLTPMHLLRIPEPFDHPEFIFEPKIDGFRALAQIRGHRAELISRNGYSFRSWPQLPEELAHAVRCQSAVLDGEICCLNPDGHSDTNCSSSASRDGHVATVQRIDRSCDSASLYRQLLNKTPIGVRLATAAMGNPAIGIPDLT